MTLDTDSRMIHGLFTNYPHNEGKAKMKRKPPNLAVSLPKCHCCGNYWRPALGVNANNAYCKRCAKQRHEHTADALGLKRLSRVGITGDFLLPRRLRSS